jgi:hypothetical protein
MRFSRRAKTHRQDFRIGLMFGIARISASG